MAGATNPRRGTFASDFEWQMQFERAIRRRVGPHLMKVAPLLLDMKRNTDFDLVFTTRDRPIAARIRSAKYQRYQWDVTFRSRRDTGARTEWQKIVEDGFGSMNFYGIHTGQARDLDPWWLLDLDVLREMYAEHGDAIIARRHKPNGDGTYFHVIHPVQLARRLGRRDLIVDYYFRGWQDQTRLPLSSS